MTHIKDVYIKARVSRRQREMFRKAAQKRGLTVSELILTLIEEESKKEKESKNRSIK